MMGRHGQSLALSTSLKRDTFCLIDLSFDTVTCPQRHQKKYVTAIKYIIIKKIFAIYREKEKIDEKARKLGKQSSKGAE